MKQFRKTIPNYVLLIVLIVGSFAAMAAWTYGPNREPKTDRYFFVGFAADATTRNGTVYTGGADIVLTNYPNVFDLAKLISTKSGLKNVHILGVSEQSKTQHDIFWKKNK